MMRKTYLQYLAKTHIVFSQIALLFGIFFMTIIPPLWGVDEIAHFARSFQIAEGQILPHQNQDGSYGGSLPRNLVELNGYVYSDLTNNNQGTAVIDRKDVDSTDKYRKMLAEQLSDDRVEYPFPGSVVYTPLAYVGPVLGIWLANLLDLSVGWLLILSRLFSLLVYIAIVATSLYMLRDHKSRWAIFIVGLMPLAVFQASIANADSILIALSLLFVSLLLRLTYNANYPINNKLLWLIATVAVILPLIKINYIILSSALVLVRSQNFKNRKSEWLYKLSVAAITLILSLSWLGAVSSASQSIGSLRPDKQVVSMTEQTQYILENPLQLAKTGAKTTVYMGDNYIKDLVSRMGWNGVSSPLVVVMAIYFSLFIALLYAAPEFKEHRRIHILNAIISILGVLGIAFVLYLTFTPVGRNIIEGIQGRYFIPYLIPILLAMSLLVPVKLTMTEHSSRILFITVSTLCLLISLIYYILAVY